MPWPKMKIQLNKSFGSSPRETYIEDTEKGICIPKTEECNKKLPDAENFKIQNQIKAGVTLNEVNTKIIGIEHGLNIKEFSEAIEETITTENQNNKE